MGNFQGKTGKSRSISIVNKRYLKKIGIKAKLPRDVLSALEEGSEAAKKAYDKFGGRLPLLSLSGELPRKFVRLQKGMALKQHRNTSRCPPRVLEVVPVQSGCQLNCQYCLTFSEYGLQKEVAVYNNYANWLAREFRNNRAGTAQKGTTYYFSAKTEAFSPQMVADGIAGGILAAFAEHVRNEDARLGSCPDTMIIVTKAGKEELFAPSPDGATLLELLSEVKDNVQICSSISYLGNNPELRQALEPGARPKLSRLEMVRTLQQEGILAQGALVQPVFPVCVPDEGFWQELREAGIGRVSLDIFTTTPQNLALVAQIFGWFEKELEKGMFEAYLDPDAPSKDGIRKGIRKELQYALYEKLIRMAGGIGLKVSYCRSVQKAIGLGKLNYGETGRCPSGGCMANITRPTQELIREARTHQPHFGKGGAVE